MKWKLVNIYGEIAIIHKWIIDILAHLCYIYVKSNGFGTFWYVNVLQKPTDKVSRLCLSVYI